MVSYEIFRCETVSSSSYVFLTLSIIFFALMGMVLLFLALNVPMDRWTWFFYLDIVLTGAYAIVVVKGRYNAKRLSR